MRVKQQLRMVCIRCEEVTEEPKAGALFLEHIQLPIPAVFCRECHDSLVHEWGLVGLEGNHVVLVEDEDGTMRFVPASSVRGFLQ